MAQRWEDLPPTSVARVWFPLNLPQHHIWFSPCCVRFLSSQSPVFPSPQKPTQPNSNSIQNAQLTHLEWALVAFLWCIVDNQTIIYYYYYYYYYVKAPKIFDKLLYAEQMLIPCILSLFLKLFFFQLHS